MRSPWPALLAVSLLAEAIAGCARSPGIGHAHDIEGDGGTSLAAVSAARVSQAIALLSDAGIRARTEPPPRLSNRIAYIPPQCFTKTRADGEDTAKNPCYACHTRSDAPNYANDEALQLRFSLPPAAKKNPWTNLFAPPVFETARPSDEEILAYVRRSNYFNERGEIALAAALSRPPPSWDANGNGKWDGFTPDVWFHFDDRGFDHRPDGSMSGWRAFAYYPFPGTFFPANGSADDVAIRLDPTLQENEAGQFDAAVYAVNLAIVEALIGRTDVVVDPVDEKALGVDLDRNGRLGTATRVVFDGARDGKGETRMQYVGRAHLAEASSFFPIAPGLYPLGTEFFHTVRYLDVGSDGEVTMAARMKEVRYAKKVRWASYEIARANAAREAEEQAESFDGTHDVAWSGERGVFTRTWLLQGFIESEGGSLRPQTFEETAFCEGCHAGIGATADATFSFARKIDEVGGARGWFHWSQHDLRGIREPKRADGQYEYSYYLEQAGAGDELRENAEVIGRFFDDRHELRPAAVTRLHGDISYLLLPSPERAIKLDRAYLAIVHAQSFDKGRDAVLEPVHNVYVDVPLGAPTGVEKAAIAEHIVSQVNVSTAVMKSSHGKMGKVGN